MNLPHAAYDSRRGSTDSPVPVGKPGSGEMSGGRLTGAGKC